MAVFQPCDEFDHGFGWREEGLLERTAHALVADGACWLVDPLADKAFEGRVRSAGEPAGVIQLLDRHARDCGEVAERLGVPLYVVPFEGIARSPFNFLHIVRMPGWREVALWWPDARALVFADALGTASYFRSRGERLAVHPFLRLLPPKAMARGLTPTHVLCGHGEGVHGDEAAVELERALVTARRGAPRWLADQARKRLRR